MPDAYLMCPVRPSQLNAIIVEAPAGACGNSDRLFLVVFALLFGFRSSVNGFTRFSVFFQSIARRLAHLPMTMFYDDASLQDLRSARGEGQRVH